MSSGGARVHVPVLRDRVIELLAPALAAPGAVLVDATLGLGGHTRALLEACPGAVAVGIDRDRQALVQAAATLRDFGPRLRAVHAAYDRIGQVLADLAIGAVQAVLFDLGVSSMQLDQTERGFAYRVDAPLDMRMDQDNGLTAARVLNEYDAAGLERILREYGEERYAARIARAVVREREREPFSGSGRLVRLLHQVIPAAAQRTGGHPAKQTFQALRIEVNGELASWRRALPAAIRALAIGGRVAVLSYHSLEDRVAKQELAAGARDRTPQDLPVRLPGYAPYLRLLTHGAERASAQESHDNPRATSARLRAAERIRKEQPA